MKPADTPMPRDDVLFRELDDGCVLYDPENEKVHSLNLTAGFVWCLMDGTRSLTAIADEIRATCDAEETAVLRDVVKTTERFARQGLLQ